MRFDNELVIKWGTNTPFFLGYLGAYEERSCISQLFFSSLWLG